MSDASPRSRWLASVQQLLFFAIVVFFSSNWFFKLAENSLVNGLSVDYLIPKLYFTDLLIIAYLLVTGLVLVNRVGVTAIQQKLSQRLTRKPEATVVITIVLTALLGVRQLFTPFPLAATVFYLQSLLHLMFFLTLIKNPPRLDQLRLGLIVALTWQSILGIFQFLTQRALMGYTFFGEPAIDKALNLARGDFWFLDSQIGTQLGLRVLPYGTFPHPNILAGFLVMGILSLVLLNRVNGSKSAARKASYTYLISLGFGLLWTLCLFLTQSLTAFVALGLGVLFLKKRLEFFMLLVIFVFFSVSLLLPVFEQAGEIQNTSVTRRSVLTVAALQLFKNSPGLGVGLQQFSGLVEDVLRTGEPVRFVQPVHNVVLLWGAETGLLGLSIVALLSFILFKRRKTEFLFVAAVFSPVLFFDHYLLSIEQGQLILIFFLLSVYQLNSNRLQ